MSIATKSTFREEAATRGFDPDYLFALAHRLELPAPNAVDDPFDFKEVMAQLDAATRDRAIAAVHVANFKAIGKAVQRIPLAPITLVFGPNSAGKSSLLQALLYASHVQSEGELNVKHPQKGGTVVDLGNFSSTQHRHDRESSIVLGFEFAHHFRKGRGDSKPAIWWVTLGFHSGQSEPSLLRAELEIDGSVYAWVSSGSSGSFQIEADLMHPQFFCHFEKFLEDVSPIQRSKFVSLSAAGDTYWTGLVWPLLGCFEEARVTCEGLMPDSIDYGKSIDRIVESWVAPINDDFEFVWVNRSNLAEPYGRLADAVLTECTRTLSILRETLQSFLKNLSYLSSTRIQPGRDFEHVTQRDANFEVNGGRSWHSLASTEGVITRDRLNRWFSELHEREKRGLARYQFGVAYDLNRNLTTEVIETEAHNYLMEKYQEHEVARAQFSEKDPNALEAYAFPFDKLDASEFTARIVRALEDKRNATTNRRLTIHDMRANTQVTSADIGVGIQFLIPVLVEMLSGGPALKIIEEPELHAHPALQAELGDALIEGALADQQTGQCSRYLIETHSEHLILRILRRIRETSEGSTEYPSKLPKIRPEDVAVVYAEPSPSGTVLRHLRIDADGRFVDDWPVGFFAERLDEVLR